MYVLSVISMEIKTGNCRIKKKPNKTPKVFISLKLQITSRVSWYKSHATQKGKIIIHNTKTFCKMLQHL